MKKPCAGCGTKTETTMLIHVYNKKLYCSKGCVAKARWNMVST